MYAHIIYMHIYHSICTMINMHIYCVYVYTYIHIIVYCVTCSMLLFDLLYSRSLLSL